MTYERLGLVAILGFASVARAENPNPGIMPTGHALHGKTYAQWAAEWFQWELSIPYETSPFFDSTGEYADLRQHGPVWFLTFGYGDTRTVTIPPDTWLFFPVINLIWVNAPSLGDDPWSPMQREKKQGWVAAAMDTVVELSCEIDGVPVSDLASYEAGTADGDEYLVRLPDDNLLGIPAGTYGPSVDDGFYLMLRPLSAGEHTIHMYAADKFGIELETTYDLTVEEGHDRPGR